MELIDEGNVIEDVDDRITPFVGLGSTGMVGIRRADGVGAEVCGVAVAVVVGGSGGGGGDGALDIDGVSAGAGV